MLNFRQNLLKFSEKMLRRRRRGRSAVVLPFFLDFRQRILVLLPEKANFPPLHEIIRRYQQFFDGVPVQFVAHAGRAGDIPPDLQCIYYSEDSATIFGRLTPAIAGDLAHHDYQLAIDLNDRFALIPALICLKSGAPVRVSFDKPEGTFYYNVILRTNGEEYPVNLERMLGQLRAVIGRPETAGARLDPVTVK